MSTASSEFESNSKYPPVNCKTLDDAVFAEPNRKFMYFLSLERLAAFCCCKVLTLYQGMLIIGYIEISSALLGLVYTIFSGVYTNFYYTITTIIRSFAFIPGCLCIIALKKSSLKSAEVAYHWKRWEPFILAVLRLVGLVKESLETLSQSNFEYLIWLIIGTSILTVLSVVYSIYACYIIYSYIQLVENGNFNLIRYGPDVLDTMLRIKNQAEAMDMQPVIPVEISDKP